LYFFLFLFLLIVGGYYCYQKYLQPEMAISKAIRVYAKADLIRSDINLTVISEKSRFATTSAVIVYTLERTSSSTNIQAGLDINSGTKEAVAEVRRVGKNVYVFISKLDMERLNPFLLELNRWNILSPEESLALYKPFLLDPEPLIRNGLNSLAEAYARLHVNGALKNVKLIGGGFIQGRPVARYSADVDAAILAGLVENGVERWSFSPVIISTDILDGSLKQISAEFLMSVVTIDGPDMIKIKASVTYDGSAETKVEAPNSQNPPFMI